MRHRDHGVFLIWVIGLLIIPAANVQAQDSRLAALRSALVPLRANAGKYPVENRGAVPELTTVKHLLRDLVESRMTGLQEKGDEKAIERSINSDLQTAGLTSAEDRDNYIGFLDDIELSRNSGLLILKTSVGILCWYDESVYGYEWAKDHWKRIWESEQVDYSAGKYSPQHLQSIHVWQPFDSRKGKFREERFVLSLGHETWCSSNWHDVYWRLWRIDNSGAKLLVNDSRWAFLRADGYIVGSIGGSHENGSTKADVLIEFTQDSIDSGVHNREAIRHYVLDQESVHRVAPVALSPRDFVDEWLTSPWIESSGWSNSPALRAWHTRLKGSVVFSPTTHCRTSDLWQVTMTTLDPKRDFADGPEMFFLIRWRPPFNFTMMGISERPWPLCNQKDPEADEWRTLFWQQNWR